jgi:uncharacterized protein YndB with AHSA1/START domain
MTQAKKPPVVVERTYEGTPAELWELWTTKSGFESWWGPEGFRVEVHKIEPRVGGALEYDMIADSPEMIAVMKQMGQPASHGTHGTFAEVELHKRLRVLYIIDFLPGQEPYENNIVLELSPVGNKVNMRVSIDAHPADEWTQRSLEGFQSQLEKLPAALTGLRNKG